MHLSTRSVGRQIRVNACKNPGHFAKDCPQAKELVKGSVFSMTHDQIDLESAIVTCMIRIVDLPDNALIDTGATHSFISVKFLMKLGILPDESISGFSVSFPSGKELKSNQVIKYCKIRMQGLDLYADFIMLEMADFDIILGLDRLTRHEVVIDCKQRTMILKVQNGEPFVFYVASKRSISGMISAGKAWQLLNKGCTSFLASLMGEQDIQ
ncbi:uncharacterized protein [Henckelia pumila]|uniref:uncharacterized protein n=1 Tax=Henckelia pumila TaxID=405737 RepID=UPI003C6DDBCE